jgi:hypothetical protein
MTISLFLGQHSVDLIWGNIKCCFKATLDVAPNYPLSTLVVFGGQHFEMSSQGQVSVVLGHHLVLSLGNLYDLESS